MALRRPTLLFCVLTIVLGVHYEIRHPSPADGILSMVIARQKRNRGVSAVPVGRKKHWHKPSTSDTEQNGPSWPLEEGARVKSTEADTTPGNKPLAQGGGPGMLSACCSVLRERRHGVRNSSVSDEIRNSTVNDRIWKSTFSRSYPQPPPTSSPTRTGMMRRSPAFLATIHPHCPRKTRSSRNASLEVSPLSTSTTAVSEQYDRQSLVILNNQSEDSGPKTTTDDISHHDKERCCNTHALPVAHRARCRQEHSSPLRKPLKSDNDVFRFFYSLRKPRSERKDHPEINALRLEGEDGYVREHARNGHNFSIPDVWENCEMQLREETTAADERQMMVFSLCISLLLFRNEDFRQAMTPLLQGLKETTNIRQLVEEFLKRITNNGFNGLSLQDSGDSAPPDGPTEGLKKDNVHDQLNTSNNSAHVSELPHSRFQDREPADGATAEKTDPYRQTRWLTAFRTLVPRRLSTFMAAPVSFFPTIGSSGKDAMSHLGCRLASLSALPASCKTSRVRLANSGFYYDTSKAPRTTADRHEVTCYSCGVSYAQWKEGDIPDEIHRRLKPDCVHLKEMAIPANTAATNSESSMSSNGNASTLPSSGYWSMNEGSLGSGSMSSAHTNSVDTSPPSSDQADAAGVSGGRAGSVSTATDHRSGSHQPLAPRTDAALVTTGPGDLATDCAAILPSAVTSATPSTNQTRPQDRVTAPLSTPSSWLSTGDWNSSARTQDLDERPLLSMNEAVYPQFSRMQDRRATFVNWPLLEHFHPDELVIHGFYYAGYADCIRCFYCGVGLKSWCRDDDVMEEHIRWRPSCGYILNTKGKQFVNSVLQRIQASSSGSQSSQTGRQNPGNGTTTTTTTSSTQTNTTTATTQTPSTRNTTSSNTPTSNGTAAHSSSPATTASTNTTTSATTRNSSTAASTGVASGSSSSSSSSASNGSSNGRELLKTVAEMGFDNDTIARAVRQLQQEGAATIGVDALVNKILEMTPERDEANSGNADATRNNDLHTDGEEEATNSSAAEVEPSQWLASENARLRDRNRCRVCHEAKVGMIFLPCGHILACTDCGSRMRHCSQCGEFIKATANVYL